MKNKERKNNEIVYDYSNEIGINDLIQAIDISKNFSLFEINEEDCIDTGEKNILIKINKIKKDEVSKNAI